MIEKLLSLIVGLLAVMAYELDAIRVRLKDRFPTTGEEDSRWAQKDPLGHWEAHKNEIKSKKS
jgi:hypothetical protein